jgi:hypothetical protein
MSPEKKNLPVQSYRVLMQDDNSPMKFAIYVNAIGMVTAERAALDEFPWAHVIGIKQGYIVQK